MKLEQGIGAPSAIAREPLAQQDRPNVQTPIERPKEPSSLLPPLDLTVPRTRRQHYRIMSDPQPQSSRSSPMLNRDIGDQSLNRIANYPTSAFSGYRHSRTESCSTAPTPYQHSRNSSGADSIPAVAYAHSRNDSATDLHQPGHYISGPPPVTNVRQPYPSPPSTGVPYAAYSTHLPSYSSHGISDAIPRGIPPIQAVVPTMPSSGQGHHHHHSTSIIGAKKRRGNLPKHAVRMLKKWVEEHKDNPYPNEEEKNRFCVETNLSASQINNWFINARRRNLTQEERERMRRNRTEASGSQTSDSRPNSAQSFKEAPYFGRFGRSTGEGPNDG